MAYFEKLKQANFYHPETSHNPLKHSTENFKDESLKVNASSKGDRRSLISTGFSFGDRQGHFRPLGDDAISSEKGHSSICNIGTGMGNDKRAWVKCEKLKPYIARNNQLIDKIAVAGGISTLSKNKGYIKLPDETNKNNYSNWEKRLKNLEEHLKLSKTPALRGSRPKPTPPPPPAPKPKPKPKPPPKQEVEVGAGGGSKNNLISTSTFLSGTDAHKRKTMLNGILRMDPTSTFTTKHSLKGLIREYDRLVKEVKKEAERQRLNKLREGKEKEILEEKERVAEEMRKEKEADELRKKKEKEKADRERKEKLAKEAEAKRIRDIFLKKLKENRDIALKHKKEYLIKSKIAKIEANMFIKNYEKDIKDRGSFEILDYKHIDNPNFEDARYIVDFNKKVKTFLETFKLYETKKSDKLKALSDMKLLDAEARGLKIKLGKLLSDKSYMEKSTTWILLLSKTIRETVVRRKEVIHQQELEHQKKVHNDLRDNIRNKSAIPPLSRFYKDFFLKKEFYHKFETNKGGKKLWEEYGRKKGLSLDEMLKKYKKNLLSVILEDKLNVLIKKKKSGMYVNIPDGLYTPKMIRLIEQVRKKHDSNRNWSNLIFFKEERDNAKYKNKFKDANKIEEDKVVVKTPKRAPSELRPWWQDRDFYISPEKLVSSRHYVNDVMVAKVAYMPDKSRYKKLFTYKYAKTFNYDVDLVPKAYRSDVCVYVGSKKKKIYVGFKGTTMSNVFDWRDNFVNATGKYKGSKMYVFHQKLIGDVKTKYPNREIRVVGHSRGGFYASQIAKEFNLAGSSFTGALDKTSSGFIKIPNFNFYVSDKYDIVSEARKSDTANNVYEVLNIPGIDPHGIVNYVPRMYWSGTEIKAYDVLIQREYIKYLHKDNMKPEEQTLWEASKETLKKLTSDLVIGSLLATAVGGGGALPLAVLKGAVLFESEFNKGHSAP